MECGIVIMHKISNSRDLVKFILNTHTHTRTTKLIFCSFDSCHIQPVQNGVDMNHLSHQPVKLQYTQPRIKEILRGMSK